MEQSESLVPATTNNNPTGPQSLDPIAAYVSVFHALEALPERGAVIGQMMTRDEQLEEELEERRGEDAEEGEGKEEESEEDEGSASGWATYEELAARVARLGRYARACCGGTAWTGRPPQLTVRRTRELFQVFRGPELERLCELCDPAAFGDLRTQTTKVDAAIRSARELKASEFEITNDGLSENWEVLRGIGAEIQRDLVKEPFELVPYKLNLYPRGGFFRPHVDTPTDPQGMVGTLVVCLPSAHQGGELVVRSGARSHQGQAQQARQVFDFAQGSTQEDSVQWAAFFSHCVHEVKPVTGGMRITATYSILVGTAGAKRWDAAQACPPDAESDVDGLIDADSSEALANARAVVEVVTALFATRQQGRPLGALLRHKYTMTALTPRRLKGVDAVLYEVLRRGLPEYAIDLRSVALRRTYELWRNENSGAEVTRLVYAITKDDLAFLRGDPSAKRSANAEIQFVAGGPGELLSHEHQDGSDYTGNEAAPETDESIYFHSAVVVTPPDARQRA